MRCNSTFRLTEIIKNKQNRTVDMKCWQPSCTLMDCCWRYRIVQPLCKIAWQFLIKFNRYLYDAVILFLDIYLKQMKTYLYLELFIKIHNSVIHRNPKLEAAQMFINRGIGKNILVFKKIWIFSYMANVEICVIFRI